MYKTVSTLAQIKILAAHSYLSLCSSPLHTYSKTHSQFHLKSEKIIYFLVNPNSWAWMFLIFCVMKCEVHTSIFTARRSTTVISRKRTCVWVASWTNCCFHGARYLLERITDNLWLFRLGYLTVNFSKANEISQSLYGKLPVSVVNAKIWAFRYKIEF